MASTVRFDSDLVRRYDSFGPRYTSYPTALQFHPGFDVDAYTRVARASNEARPPTPLSLYVHIPFCASPCFYCGCNKIITRSIERAEDYLKVLFREIELQGALFDRSRRVEQLHFGGGTPTFLREAQTAGLVEQLGRQFSLITDASREYSIEIDPRTVDLKALEHLADLGFNRISLGVQDFDPEVQKAVNRIQSVDATLALITEAHRFGFNSVSVDLIYGLPLQTTERFAKTLDIVLSARPNRLAVYGYAHMPHLFKPQKRIKEEQLPKAEERLELLGLTIEKLTGAGYVYIGMDHFALPDDELVRAQNEGHLHRNFQGYSTRAHCDLIGLGVSSIGKIGDAYAQNAKTLIEYYAALNQGRLPVQRGVELNADDRLRREVIQQLMCHGVVNRRAIGAQFGTDFGTYFASELERLEDMVADGLVEVTSEQIRLTPAGRLLMRNVAMVFDTYLPAVRTTPVHSRAI